MKKYHWKKAAALALVLSLFVSLLSVVAAAEEPGTEGQGCAVGNHTPSDEPYHLNHYKYTVCGGGYADDVVACIFCGAPVNPDGSWAEYIYGTGDHSFGETHAARTAACVSGYDVDWHQCSVCYLSESLADGTPLLATDWHEASSHTPGDEKHDKDAPCCGGYMEDWFDCTACGSPTNLAGNSPAWAAGTGHTPGERYESNYTECGGGFMTEWYVCTGCGAAVNANGEPLVETAGNGRHTFGEKQEPNYTDCTGGYKTEWYICKDCYFNADANGNKAVWEDPIREHTRGTVVKADYTECEGGFKKDWYECPDCHRLVDLDGNLTWPTAGAGHIPGNEKNQPNYTDCGGGFHVEWYICQVCLHALDVNGNVLVMDPGSGGHTIEHVERKEPTYAEDGYGEFWRCTVCHMGFADSEGKIPLSEENSITIPKLGTQVVTDTLKDVPADLPEDCEYTTVEEIQTAMEEAAAKAGFDAEETNAGSVLLDVTLQIQTEDGSWEDVDSNNFPDEGVTVILPYPPGTDKSYTFVITHMITHGENAGEIEVLTGENTEEGIRVHFKSLSPVCISYMLKSSTPAPQTPASVSSPTPAAPGSSTVPKTSDANHGAPWGMLVLLSIGGLGALSIAGKKLRIF